MTVSVKVYTTPICPYCSNAKQLLKTKGVDYEEIGMHDMTSEERRALMQKTNNYRTVPQIFVGDTFVGMCVTLHNLPRTEMFSLS